MIDFGNSISRERNILLSRKFRVFLLQVGLSVGKISGRNTVIRFVGGYRAIG